MKINIREHINENNLKFYGQRIFDIGIIFLPSLLPISLILLFIALIISLSFNRISLIKDKWNFILLIAIALIIFSSINALLFNPLVKSLDDNLLILINPIRWILLFLCFSGFQYYLKTLKQRINFAKNIIIGTIPVFISCICQYWFKIYGPFEFLNGLIIWYNSPILDTDGVSGLFYNQNYTGLWLSITWPFSIYFLKIKKNFNIKKISLILLSAFIIYLIITTTSRAAILGILMTLPFIFSIKLIIKIILLITVLLIILLNIPLEILNNNNLFIPQTLRLLIEKLNDFNIYYLRNMQRIKIWQFTYNLVLTRPIWGFGAGIFPILYYSQNPYNAQHSHNIVLQMAFDYGILVSILLTTFVYLLLFRTWKNLYVKTNFKSIKNNQFDIYWFAASLVALVSQLYDVTYFEGRIAILIWIFLAGLKTINDDNIKVVKK